MIKLLKQGVYISPEGEVVKNPGIEQQEAEKNTMTYGILRKHNCGSDMEKLNIRFDALVSPDNNYVSILQTAIASGVREFPVPYVLSNCHHTLCAVGGTINEDDHVFGLDNAKKYGGIFVPPYRAVLHQYMREMMAGGGKMILGSDSHTRYGVLGTLAVGEGGGEVAKQLLGKTYDIKRPQVIAVKLIGKPQPGVGPQDVALAMIGATFKSGFNKNKILEFVGEGINNLSVEYRMGIDVMTTESAALSSVWCTDDKVEKYLEVHGRKKDYREMKPKATAYYDGMIEIDLSKVQCMMALPFHPSNVCTIEEFKQNHEKYIKTVEEEGQLIKGSSKEAFNLKDKLIDGELHIDQALVSGCSGGMFENIVAMADILNNCAINGSQASLGINPASQPIYLELMRQGIASELTIVGATMRPAICGPCFGVTDVPANNQLSIRHTTRNYPNREGSKPGNGQMAAVILMDARSIAATIRNGGRLTAATELQVEYRDLEYTFDSNVYKNQVFNNYKKGNPKQEIKMGPNIAPWPTMYPLNQHALLKVAGVYEGSVTTDELIPSGEASSYRSNPHKISEFTMISRDKEYVARAKAVRELENLRREGKLVDDSQCEQILREICSRMNCTKDSISIGSVIISDEIGDGSSREQAASCQKVLGGLANIAKEYSTKRYRSNLINWGILPFVISEDIDVENGEYIFIPNVIDAIKNPGEIIAAEVIGRRPRKISLSLDQLTEDEKNILLEGSLINFNK